MFWSRFSAFAVVVLAVLWIGSGYFGQKHGAPQPNKVEQKAAPLFRVVVSAAQLQPHARRFNTTGRTQSDQRVIVSARTAGIVTKLSVKRGSSVAAGEVIAELADEARESMVQQGRSRLAQRRAELEAREALAKKGSYPLLNLEQLRAEMSAAEAALAQAEAELQRTTITAPVTGIINDLPVEIGQGLSVGNIVAEIIVPHPMLAVVEVPERRLAGLKIGDKAEIRLVTGERRTGSVRFIARRNTGQTRTYRLDVLFDNVDGTIPDGIAAEVTLALAPMPAMRVPRSALTFSADGRLGLRFVDGASMVGFAPVTIIDDEDAFLWVGGVETGMKIITRGQEFIREGQKVEAVSETGTSKPAQVAP